ncbi:hypothetical protein C8R47DRAFT_1129842 [Mycena vitilis]|nr:hypothetical protein C8R47DRAFT_1129842 [Mycena vitilis]
MLSPLVLPHGWLLLSPFWPCRLTILERRPAASDLVPTPFVGSLSSFPTPFCDPASFPPRSRLVLATALLARPISGQMVMNVLVAMPSCRTPRAV